MCARRRGICWTEALLLTDTATVMRDSRGKDSFKELALRDRLKVVLSVEHGRRIKNERLGTAAHDYARRTVAEYANFDLRRRPLALFDQPFWLWIGAAVVVGVLIDQRGPWWMWPLSCAGLLGAACVSAVLRVKRRVANAVRAGAFDEDADPERP